MSRIGPNYLYNSIDYELEPKEPLYPKPKVLLIDLDEECTLSLQTSGFNVKSGTLGEIYHVSDSSFESYTTFVPVKASCALPNLTEQEITVINLDKTIGYMQLPNEKTPSLYMNGVHRVVDSRYMAVNLIQKDLQRILMHGGVFVIFAAPKRIEEIGTSSRIASSGIEVIKKISLWDLLDVFQFNLNIEPDQGTEMISADGPEPLKNLLMKYAIGDSHFNSKFSPNREFAKFWTPLLKNKYGDCVSGLISGISDKSIILLLPQIDKKDEFLDDLFINVLPELCPHLFPNFEGERWVNRKEYQPSEIIALERNIADVKLASEKNIAELETQIATTKNEFHFLYDILTKHDRALVKAIKASFEYIGFKKVIDVDSIKNSNENQEEDLQIQEGSPLLIVECKGIAGFPNETDIMQLVKYLPRRMKELKRTDVHGVFIVNHQRNIPALDRDDLNIFTDKQIQDATDCALISTWDLFRLIRGMRQWGWPKDAIKKLFYRAGKVPCVPAHYEPIGEIQKVWKKNGALGIRLMVPKLDIDNRVAVILNSQFFEGQIKSIMVNDIEITTVKREEGAGLILTIEEKIPEGIMLWRVNNSNKSQEHKSNSE